LIVQSSMPFKVRKLKGEYKGLIDISANPANHVTINPSRAGEIIYIRDIEFNANENINRVILFNTATNVTSVIDVPWDLLCPTQGHYKGLEDLRIVWYKSRLYFTATCTHASKRMQSEMVLGAFSKDLTKIVYIQYMDLGTPPVKNVCPFIYKDALHLIDSYSGLIYEVDVSHEETEDKFNFTIREKVKLKKQEAQCVFGGNVRGSTCPIHLHGHTWGCLVHDIIYSDNVVSQVKSKLAYVHQWMEFDIESGLVTFTSSPFFFTKFGIEFASGLVVDVSAPNNITVYAGIEDRYPIIIRTTLNDLRA